MKTKLFVLYLIVVISYLPWIVTAFSWGTSGSYVEYIAILGWTALIFSCFFISRYSKIGVLIAFIAAFLIWAFQWQTIESFLHEGEAIAMLGLSIIQAILLLAVIYSSLNYFISLSNYTASTKLGINIGVTILLSILFLKSFTGM